MPDNANDDIPDFLKRNPDNTVKDDVVIAGPRGGGMTPATVVIPQGMTQSAMRDAEQASLREAQAMLKTRKSYTRLAKMNERKMVKEGKTWDSIKAKWV